MGGSPNSKDTCTRGIPNALVFSSSGQSRLWGKIVLNVRVNYLPQALLDSASDCKNKCDNVLRANIISGDSSAISIKASYILGSQYSFSVEVDFGKEPIGMFVLQVGINPALIGKYFSGVSAGSTLNINVNPAQMASVTSNDNLTR